MVNFGLMLPKNSPFYFLDLRDTLTRRYSGKNLELKEFAENQIWRDLLSCKIYVAKDSDPNNFNYYYSKTYIYTLTGIFKTDGADQQFIAFKNTKFIRSYEDFALEHLRKVTWADYYQNQLEMYPRLFGCRFFELSLIHGVKFNKIEHLFNPSLDAKDQSQNISL
jgi:hypothetical protein